MASPEQNPSQEAARVLQRIHVGFEKRRSLPGGAAREKLDAHLLAAVGELSRVQGRVLRGGSDGALPRPVTLAHTLALHSHAHLTLFFGELRYAATEPLERPAKRTFDAPIVLDPAHALKVSGLAEWEFEDLREEVDRRVGSLMKQERALDWLWGHFAVDRDGPSALFQVLFPGLEIDLATVGLARLGAQLYAIVDRPEPGPRAALFLPWFWRDGDNGVAPPLQFQPRYVDVGLKGALARGIGATDEEVSELLDRMVTVVPRGRAADFLQHDQWRSQGFAGMCALGGGHASARDLVRALRPEDVAWKEWVRVEGGAVKVPSPRDFFDALALPRVAGLVPLLYADLLAAAIQREGGAAELAEPSLDELEIFDLPRLLRAIFQPLFDWAGSPATAEAVAAALSVPKDRAAAGLAEMADAWRAQMDRGWYAAPAPRQPRSVASVLTIHLAQTWRNLNTIWAENAGARWEHRDLLALYAGHLYADFPVHKLWSGGLNECGAPAEDLLGGWFWPAWTKMFDAGDNDSETFSGQFELEV